MILSLAIGMNILSSGLNNARGNPESRTGVSAD